MRVVRVCGCARLRAFVEWLYDEFGIRSVILQRKKKTNRGREMNYLLVCMAVHPRPLNWSVCQIIVVEFRGISGGVAESCCRPQSSTARPCPYMTTLASSFFSIFTTLIKSRRIASNSGHYNIHPNSIRVTFSFSDNTSIQEFKDKGRKLSELDRITVDKGK